QLGWSLSTLRRKLEHGRELLRLRLSRRGATLGAGLFAGVLAPTAESAGLTPELRQSVLCLARADLTGGAVPATVALLAKGAMSMTLTRLFVWSVLVVALGGIAAGACWRFGLANEERGNVEAAADEPARQPAAGHDWFNDPLPRGAVARLGTVAFRHRGASWG